MSAPLAPPETTISRINFNSPAHNADVTLSFPKVHSRRLYWNQLITRVEQEYSDYVSADPLLVHNLAIDALSRAMAAHSAIIGSTAYQNHTNHLNKHILAFKCTFSETPAVQQDTIETVQSRRNGHRVNLEIRRGLNVDVSDANRVS